MDRVTQWRNVLRQVAEVSFILHLTHRCNFRCGHCMYSAGPHASPNWVSFNVVEKLFSVIAPFQQAGISCRLNLIGGEPTVDLDRFEETLDLVTHFVQSTPVGLEMTTNGWWLDDFKTFERFAQIVRPALQHEMFIRISNSPWHDLFRKRPVDTLTNGGLARMLECVEDHYRIQALCDCGGIIMYDHPQSTCSNCGETFDEQQYFEQKDRIYHWGTAEAFDALREAAQQGQVYVDRRLDSSRVSFVGRAALNSIGNQHGECSNESLQFTITPEGAIRDVCCFGGQVPLGHLEDGAWSLFALRYEFMQALHQQYPCPHQRCEHCAVFAAQWLVDHRKTLQEDIHRFMETCEQEQNEPVLQEETA